MATVDIIMAAYNEEKTVGAAIDSVLSQTYNDWRLLLCDDGSIDNTYKILKEYSAEYPGKIVAIGNDGNKGLTYTLNRLISVSSAKYIARMDADDRCKPERLEKQVAFLDSHPEYAMTGTAIEKFDEKGVFTTVKYPEKPNIMSFLWNSPFAHPSIMIRQDILIKLKGYRDELRTQRCEDYDLWMRMYEDGYQGYNIQEPLFEYYEGRYSYGKRKFKYRIAEMQTRFYGFRRLGLLPEGLLYVIKPILVGLVPAKIMVYIRRAKQND